MWKRETIVRDKSVLCKTIAFAAMLAAAAPAAAHEAKSRFEMTVVRDAAYGAKIVSGDVASAIDRIEHREFRRSDRFFVNNNLCVAYTMMARFDKAEIACDTAVQMMRERLDQRNDRHAVINTRYQAMALTNRGVLNAVRGEPERARMDFERASELRAGSAAPVRNLAYLDVRGEQPVAR